MQIVCQDKLSVLTDKKLQAYKYDMRLISTAEAAEKLGVHITRVQVLIREGRLPALMVGGSYIINEDDLKLVKDRKPGRPPKANQAPEKPATAQPRRSNRSSGKQGSKQ